MRTTAPNYVLGVELKATDRTGGPFFFLSPSNPWINVTVSSNPDKELISILYGLSLGPGPGHVVLVH
jgi:hypothetical protein